MQPSAESSAATPAPLSRQQVIERYQRMGVSRGWFTQAYPTDISTLQSVLEATARRQRAAASAASDEPAASQSPSELLTPPPPTNHLALPSEDSSLPPSPFRLFAQQSPASPDNPVRQLDDNLSQQLSQAESELVPEADATADSTYADDNQYKQQGNDDAEYGDEQSRAPAEEEEELADAAFRKSMRRISMRWQPKMTPSSDEDDDDDADEQQHTINESVNNTVDAPAIDDGSAGANANIDGIVPALQAEADAQVDAAEAESAANEIIDLCDDDEDYEAPFAPAPPHEHASSLSPPRATPTAAVKAEPMLNSPSSPPPALEPPSPPSSQLQHTASPAAINLRSPSAAATPQSQRQHSEDIVESDDLHAVSPLMLATKDRRRKQPRNNRRMLVSESEDSSEEKDEGLHVKPRHNKRLASSEDDADSADDQRHDNKENTVVKPPTSSRDTFAKLLKKPSAPTTHKPAVQQPTPSITPSRSTRRPQATPGGTDMKARIAAANFARRLAIENAGTSEDDSEQGHSAAGQQNDNSNDNDDDYVSDDGFVVDDSDQEDDDSEDDDGSEYDSDSSADEQPFHRKPTTAATPRSHASTNQHHGKRAYSSVDGSNPEEMLRPATRDSHTARLYKVLNTNCFGSALPADLQITWNKKMNKTAGFCYMSSQTLTNTRTGEVAERKYIARIELATKVVDRIGRLERTLCHEMCHAAAWLIDHVSKPPHGSTFKRYSYKCMQRYPHLDIATCHNYEIFFAFRWQCTQCSHIYGRHSNSLDIHTKCCGKCRGKLVYLGKFSKNEQQQSAKTATPSQPTQYQLYVKQHYASVKASNSGATMGEVTKLIAAKYKSEKQGTQQSVSTTTDYAVTKAVASTTGHSISDDDDDLPLSQALARSLQFH